MTSRKPQSTLDRNSRAAQQQTHVTAAARRVKEPLFQFGLVSQAPRFKVCAMYFALRYWDWQAREHETYVSCSAYPVGKSCWCATGADRLPGRRRVGAVAFVFSGVQTTHEEPASFSDPGTSTSRAFRFGGAQLRSLPWTAASHDARPSEIESFQAFVRQRLSRDVCGLRACAHVCVCVQLTPWCL